MRTLLAAATLALAIIASLAVTATAGAAGKCSYSPDEYSTGAPFDVHNPGPQPVNDPVYPDQWGLMQINAPAAWERGDKGAGVTVAVIDTGADLVHPDLQSKLVQGVDLTPAADQGCPGPQDEEGHGTHVSGIAAAATNNGIGVAGTAPSATVMPVRVLNAAGEGEQPTVVRGIKYAADHGAKVLNLSLGGERIVGETPQFNQEFADAVDYAYARGAVVVAAAGNESLPLCSYPAAARRTVCVAATDARGAPAAYSNLPASASDGNVGVRAPGGSGVGDPILCESSEDVWSTLWPGGDFCRNEANQDLSGYDTFAGSSMATPFVSGLAAILSAKGLSNAQILECLRTTSSNEGGYDPVMGYGIVDADAATRQCSRSTTPPFNSSTSGGSTARDYLYVTVKRTTRRRLARTRKLYVTVTSSKAVTVRLRAVMRKGRTRTLARGKVVLRKAGTRRKTLRLSRRRARMVGRARHARIQVRYRGGGHSGVAAVR